MPELGAHPKNQTCASKIIRKAATCPQKWIITFLGAQLASSTRNPPESINYFLFWGQTARAIKPEDFMMKLRLNTWLLNQWQDVSFQDNGEIDCKTATCMHGELRESNVRPIDNKDVWVSSISREILWIKIWGEAEDLKNEDSCDM